MSIALLCFPYVNRNAEVTRVSLQSYIFEIPKGIRVIMTQRVDYEGYWNLDVDLCELVYS